MKYGVLKAKHSSGFCLWDSKAIWKGKEFDYDVAASPVKTDVVTEFIAACKNILIRHNTGLQGHGGIVIGSEMSGGVKNIFEHDCKFFGTDRAIRIKTARGRGGYVKNCWFKNISADSIEREAIRINMMYTGGDRLPALKVTSGTPVMPVKNVTLKNINLRGRTGIEISDAKNITLDNLSISDEKGSFTKISFCDSITVNNIEIINTDENKVPFIINDVDNTSLNNVKYNLKGELVHITVHSEKITIDKSIPENKINWEVMKK